MKATFKWDSYLLSFKHFISFFFLTAAYFYLVVTASPEVSPTYDEPAHIRSGMTILTRGAFVDTKQAWWSSIDPLHPPFDIIPALFAKLSGQTPDYRAEMQTDFEHLLSARWANHILGYLILLLLAFWVNELFGATRAVVACAALLCQPLFLSSATIVSSDLYFAFGGLLSTICLSRFFLQRHFVEGERTRFASSILLSLVLAFGVVCKLANLLFLGLVPILSFVWFCRLGEMRSRRTFLQCLFYATVPAFLALVFSDFFYGLAYQSLEKLSIEAWPLPFDFGIEMANAYFLASGLGANMPYVHFSHSLEPGAWYHYFVIYLLRTPVGLILAQALGFIFCVRYALKNENPALRFILLLSIFCLGYFTTRGFYLGLRHLLFPIVLSSIFCCFLYQFESKKRLGALVLVAGLSLSFVELLYVQPWQMSYVNFLGKGRLTAIADADWGQGLIALSKWQQEHSPDEKIWLSYFGSYRPETFGVKYRGLTAPFTPQKRDRKQEMGRNPENLSGYIALSATRLTGRFMKYEAKPSDYFAAWQGREPKEIIAGTIYIYELPGKNSPNLK